MTLTTHCVKTRPAMIVELAQRAVSVEPDLMSQFFDLNSAVHPGGPSAALLLAAAASVVRAHGGRVDARRDDPVGCTITFVLPQSSAEASKASTSFALARQRRARAPSSSPECRITRRFWNRTPGWGLRTA